MRIALRTSLPLIFAAALALAADVTGTWKGQLSTPNGDKVTFAINAPMNGGTKIPHTGKAVSASEIQMKMDIGDRMSQTFTIKKQ